MLVLKSTSINPFYNLALEEYLFENSEEDVFMLWQNHNTIVVGQYQNTIEEISNDYVKKNKINVVRRLSGGGAVYHDLGNINFTFITRGEAGSFSFEHFTKHIRDVLNAYNIKCNFSGRNDLHIGGRKFSGNAQYIKNGKVLHHGTLLYNSNLEVLTKALQANQTKMQSKAIKSIHERVTNIKDHMEEDISIEDFMDSLYAEIARLEETKIINLTEDDEEMIQKKVKERYGTWEWNYGASPKSNLRKTKKHDYGLIDIYLDLVNGHIDKIKIHGDFFARGEMSEIENALVGCKFEDTELRKTLKQFDNYIVGIDEKWLTDTLLY